MRTLLSQVSCLLSEAPSRLPVAPCTRMWRALQQHTVGHALQAVHAVFDTARSAAGNWHLEQHGPK